MAECQYRNCPHTPRSDSKFCSQACERYHYRETGTAFNYRVNLVKRQRKQRRELVYKVVTHHWKNAYELYLPLRLEGYEATLKTLQRDLQALVEAGLVESRDPKRKTGGNPTMEYRKPERKR